MAAAKSKTTFLSTLARLKGHRETIVFAGADQDFVFGFYRGKLEIVGDVVSPIYGDEELEQFYGRSAEQLTGSGRSFE